MAVRVVYVGSTHTITRASDRSVLLEFSLSLVREESCSRFMGRNKLRAARMVFFTSFYIISKKKRVGA